MAVPQVGTRYTLNAINPPKDYDNYTAVFRKIKNYEDDRPSVYVFYNVGYPPPPAPAADDMVVDGPPPAPILRREIPAEIKVSPADYNFNVLAGGRRRRRQLQTKRPRRNTRRRKTQRSRCL